MNRSGVLPAGLLLAGVVALCANAAWAAEGTFEKTFSVGHAPSVSVSTGSGYLHVYPGSDSQVHVTGHVHARAGWFGSDADTRVKEIVANPPLSQSGDTVTVGGEHWNSSLFENISIDYDVTLPRATTLKAHTGSGNMEIGGVEGEVDAGSGSGSIKAENIGANSRFESGSGAIRAHQLHGATVVRAGSGALDVELSGAGDVTAHTGSGSIRLTGVDGALQASAGSGSIEVSGKPSSEWRVQAGSGSVHIDVGGTAKFTLNASAGSGSIHVEQPVLMQGSLNRHHVSGTVNGGGPTIRVSTGSGSISFR